MTDMAEFRESIDTAEDIQAVRDLFQSFSVSERRRLCDWFTSMMEHGAIPKPFDWSDKTEDGSRHLPTPAKSASVGLH